VVEEKDVHLPDALNGEHTVLPAKDRTSEVEQAEGPVLALHLQHTVLHCTAYFTAITITITTATITITITITTAIITITTAIITITTTTSSLEQPYHSGGGDLLETGLVPHRLYHGRGAGSRGTAGGTAICICVFVYLYLRICAFVYVYLYLSRTCKAADPT
jgi:hypothetical protein